MPPKIRIGVYRIQSLQNTSLFYIGSSINIHRRFHEHRKKLRQHKHNNTRLQKHFDKYGLKDLVYYIIEETTKDILLEREQYYLDTLKPTFNVSKYANYIVDGKMNELAKKEVSEIIKNYYKENKIKNQGKLRLGKKRGKYKKKVL